MGLLDHRGRPVDLRKLRREHADPEDSDTRTASREEVASLINPTRLATLLRAADEGDTAAYLTLAEEMEERELHYRAVLFQRKVAIGGAQVAVEAGSESDEHMMHADHVRELTRRDAFFGLLFDMQDALGKGFSLNETLWDTDGPDGQWWPGSWRWRDPRWFRLNPKTLEVSSLHDGVSDKGTPLPPWKYVRHVPKLKSGAPIRSGLARVASIAYVLKRYTIQQLVRFLEVYGIPMRIGRYSSGATKEDIRKLLRSVRKIGSDAAAVIPDDMAVEFVDGQRSGKGGGSEGFIGTAAFWDAQLSKVVLGQTMTADQGASFSQSKTHNGVRVEIAKHDARQSSASINRDIVRPFIALNFGEQERYPRIALTIVEREELTAWAAAITTFIDRGLKVDQRVVRQRLGLPEPEPGTPLLNPLDPNPGHGSTPLDDED